MSCSRLILPLLVLVLCGGCIRVDESITLQSDGSGDAQFVITFPKLGMRWLPGKPNVDWIRPNLPDTVKLKSFTNSQGKMTIKGPDGKQHELETEIFQANISFEKIADLNDIRVRPDRRNAIAAAVGGAPGKDGMGMMSADKKSGPTMGPFQNLTLTRKDDQLHFRRVLQSARKKEDVEASMMKTPGSDAQPQNYDLNDAEMKISITCPGKIIKHNAHSVKDRTLTWVFKLKELQEKQDRDWVVEFTCQSKVEK